MDVLGVVRDVIRRCAVAQVGVRNESELFEQIERAVDGGDVDAGRSFAHFGDDLIGSGMPETGDGFKDELPLRSEAVAPRPQLAVPALLAEVALSCAHAGQSRLAARSRAGQLSPSALVPEQVFATRPGRVDEIP